MDLEGKSALVTGAGSGIGRASAMALAREGAQVMIVDRVAFALDETADRIRAAGGVVQSAVADVTRPADVAQAVAACVKAYGRLDIAHNNAGVTGPLHDFLEVSREEATQIMDVNFWGVFHCLQAELPQMLKQGGGAIINTASAAGIVATPGGTPYCASKHAVMGLTKSVGAEYASRGIRINAVCPGAVETPMTAQSEGHEIMAAMIAAHPIGRIGQAEEIAEAVVWLASPRSSFVVGAGLLIDGGYSTV